MRQAIPFVAALSAFAPSVVAATPNILLIIADDMGLDASRCYDVGNGQAPMPNLEAMCRNGQVFENAYAAPVCSPTRATIMSGQYGFRTGIGSVIHGPGAQGLDDQTTSLFDVLATTDYSANLIGKWHLSGEGDGNDHPSYLGVPEYFGTFRGTARDYFKWEGIENGRRVQIDEYATTEFTNRAIDWIDRQGDDPWFLWLAYNAPHSPFHLPPADLHSFEDLPERTNGARGNALPYYQAMLEALDTEIGRLLDTMAPQVREDTIVMFLGDNGTPNQAARGVYGRHGAKGKIYEGGVNVPLIVSGPGVSKGRSDAFVNSTDLFATIASIAGASTNSPDSVDFSAALSGGASARDFVYIEHFSETREARAGAYGWAMRVGNHKLVVPEGGAQELYDLSKDPLETRDLLANGTSSAEAGIQNDILARYDALKKTPD